MTDAWMMPVAPVLIMGGLVLVAAVLLAFNAGMMWSVRQSERGSQAKKRTGIPFAPLKGMRRFAQNDKKASQRKKKQCHSERSLRSEESRILKVIK